MQLVRTFLQQLTGEQIVTLSLITLVIVQGLKIIWVGLLKKPKPGKGPMRVIVFVLSVPIGLLFSGLTLPALSDPMAFAQELIATAALVLVYSGLVYDYMLDGVLSFLDQPLVGRAGRSILAP